jgi:hypothetical protein
LELVPLAGILRSRGAAPPSSRKFTDTPFEPPLVESKAPVKYGARLTLVPLYSPAARIPGTAMPTFGLVSRDDYQIQSSSCDCDDDLQLPMTAVLTTRVKRVFWLAAVLFVNNAVV